MRDHERVFAGMHVSIASHGMVMFMFMFMHVACVQGCGPATRKASPLARIVCAAGRVMPESKHGVEPLADDAANLRYALQIAMVKHAPSALAGAPSIGSLAMTPRHVG